jgi:hypothetical protein
MDLGILVNRAALDPGARRAGQMLLESAKRLLDQLASVGEEQDALNALTSLQQLDERDGNASLSRAGRQNHQKAAACLLDSLGDCLDCFDLVRAIDDSRQWHLTGERRTKAVEMSQPKEIVFGEKAAYLAGRIVLAMPEPDFVAIGQKYERIGAGFPANGFGIVGCLPFTLQRVAA